MGKRPAAPPDRGTPTAAIAAMTTALGGMVATGNVPAVACGVVAVVVALALVLLVRGGI